MYLYLFIEILIKVSGAVNSVTDTTKKIAFMAIFLVSKYTGTIYSTGYRTVQTPEGVFYHRVIEKQLHRAKVLQ